MKFIKLHYGSGEPVYVNVANIIVFDRNTREEEKGINSVLNTIEPEYLFVKETPDEILSILANTGVFAWSKDGLVMERSLTELEKTKANLNYALHKKDTLVAHLAEVSPPPCIVFDWDCPNRTQQWPETNDSNGLCTQGKTHFCWKRWGAINRGEVGNV